MRQLEAIPVPAPRDAFIFFILNARRKNSNVVSSEAFPFCNF